MYVIKTNLINLMSESHLLSLLLALQQRLSTLATKEAGKLQNIQEVAVQIALVSYRGEEARRWPSIAERGADAERKA